jgi:multisubunit Na+/H+ antiporter MnhC subunit
MPRKPLQLADVSWTYRRWFAYGGTIINAVLLGMIVLTLKDAPALKVLALALIASNVVLALLYMAGATTTDIARLTHAVRGDQDEPEARP